MNKRKLVLRQKKAAHRVMREAKKTVKATNLKYIIYACNDSDHAPYYCVHGDAKDENGTSYSFHLMAGNNFNKFGRKKRELKFS